MANLRMADGEFFRCNYTIKNNSPKIGELFFIMTITFKEFAIRHSPFTPSNNPISNSHSLSLLFQFL